MSWGLAAFALLALALAGGFAWYERSHPSAKVLALVATLAALAAAGRIAFAPLPSVKPTTDIVLAAGFALGGAPGFAVGALAALTSNVFFGQGPWTPWQMAAWGGAGLAGAGLARLTRGRIGRWGLAAACAVTGLAFGVVMNLSTWVTFTGDHTLASFLAISGTALPFDIAHAVGNALFALAFGPALIRALERFRRRFEVRWKALPAAPAPGALGAVLAALLVAGALAAAPAQATTSVSFLQRAQNPDGGWGGAPGQSSSQLFTGWTAIGLAATGRNPQDVRRGGRSPVDFMRANAGQLNDTGELERTIIALRAAGVSPRRFAGRDLVAELLRRRRGDGAIGGQVVLTAFGVMALRAGGFGTSTAAVSRATGWLAGQQNGDGGFNFFGRGSSSGVDDTGAAIQGLVAGGRGGSRAVSRAATWLAGRQNPDGGFPLQPGGPSNAQSTAYAVQGLVAAGRNPDRVRRGGARSPLAYLRSLVAPDGSVRYSRTSGQTPVWVTGQALSALARRPLPLAPVRRRSAAGAAATDVAAAPGTAATARAGPGARPAAPAPGSPAATAYALGVAAGWVMTPLT